MTELKVGDKVRYSLSDKCPQMKGWEGEIVEMPRLGSARVKTLKNPGNHSTQVGSAGWYLSSNLELIKEERPNPWAPKPAFTFKDIQVGDKVRRTLKRKSGATEVREGTVERLQGSYATDDGYILAYVNDDKPYTNGSSVVLELLERPEPPHWTEDKPVGSVGIYMDGNFTKTLTKTGENDWHVLYAVDGYNYDDTNMGLYARFGTLDESKLTWIK